MQDTDLDRLGGQRVERASPKAALTATAETVLTKLRRSICLLLEGGKVANQKNFFQR
jgi:hypothetical protein